MQTAMDTFAACVKRAEAPLAAPSKPIMKISDIAGYYGDKMAIEDIDLEINRNQVLALIGPSGCGKSTFLKCLNRMNDVVPIFNLQAGQITFDGTDIYDRNIDVVELRARVGMIFQKANPFPKSIYDNIAYGIRIHGLANNKAEMDAMVKDALEKAALWEEVKDRLHEPGTGLSGGQQQRLCIARAIAIQPDVLLMDEPCSALDPIATAQIENLIGHLSENIAIVIVTHSLAQAARVSHKVAHFHMGKLVTYGDTDKVFLQPTNDITSNYITGRFG